ncbi:unnamed protein product, partial [Mesorhabditis belari]|uniref:Uncharacterized protein n=1 Tax=Mesorhabditis belari TaxID=2138241 RepID=A0AAF3J655_9BILA
MEMGNDVDHETTPIIPRYDTGPPQLQVNSRRFMVLSSCITNVVSSSIRNPSPLREYIPRRTTYIVFRRLINRNLQFDFEGNVAEERAIRDAIAKEEEKMLLEEENRLPTKGFLTSHQLAYHKEPPSKIRFPCRNLPPSTDDTADERTIKLVLENIVNQVCRWDSTMDGIRCTSISRNTKWLERRSQLETQAETSLGILALWRRARGRPSNKHFTKRPLPTDKDKQRHREHQRNNRP